MLVEETDYSTNAILDDWLNDTAIAQSKDFHHGSTVHTLDSLQKAGLGYVEKRSNKVPTNNDKISKILTNDVKKGIKRKIPNGADDFENRDLHGMIEEIFEESRTLVIKTIPNKNIASARQDPKNPSLPKQNNNQSNKKQKKIETEKSKHDSSVTSIPHQTKTDLMKINDQQIDAGKDMKREGKNVENGEPYKRKRKKTRSKQKNIRKDTRSNEAKPDHLKVDSTDYRGRQLTDETKKRLGIEISSGIDN